MTCETSKSGMSPGRAWYCPTRSLPSGRRAESRPSVTRVLEGRMSPPYSASHGIHPNHLGGLPRFSGCRFRGRYPVAELELRDPDVPLDVDLVTYSPLVPLDAEDSGLPCIVFRWRLTNPGSVPVAATVTGTLPIRPATPVATASGICGATRWAIRRTACVRPTRCAVCILRARRQAHRTLPSATRYW